VSTPDRPESAIIEATYSALGELLAARERAFAGSPSMNRPYLEAVSALLALLSATLEVIATPTDNSFPETLENEPLLQWELDHVLNQLDALCSARTRLLEVESHAAFEMVRLTTYRIILDTKLEELPT
jgi:hypothetical protein